MGCTFYCRRCLKENVDKCYCVTRHVQGIRSADVGSVDTRPAAVSSTHKHRSATVREKWRTIRSAGRLSRWHV